MICGEWRGSRFTILQVLARDSWFAMHNLYFVTSKVDISCTLLSGQYQPVIEVSVFKRSYRSHRRYCLAAFTRTKYCFPDLHEDSFSTKEKTSQLYDKRTGNAFKNLAIYWVLASRNSFVPNWSCARINLNSWLASSCRFMVIDASCARSPLHFSLTSIKVGCLERS